MENNILIVPASIKNKVIKENSKAEILNIKYMTLKELYEAYYFTYDTKAIYYLINKYKINYEIALIYLKNLYYIEKKEYNSEKINNLVKLKEDLDKNNLLIYDDLFPKLIRNKRIILRGFAYLKKEDYKLLDSIKKIVSVQIDDIKYQNYPINYVYAFNSRDDEYVYIATQIVKLYHNKIALENIKLLNVPRSSYQKVKRIFSFFNIKINIPIKVSIYETTYGKKYLEDFSLEKIKDNEIKQKIVNVLNKYYWTDNYESIKDMLEYEFKNTYLNQMKYDEAVELIDFDYLVSDSDYIFCSDFNTNEIPRIYKDEEYITDSIAETVYKSTSQEINKLVKIATINKLKSIKNLIITYSKGDETGQYYPSVLIDELNLEIKSPLIEYNYSNIYNKLKLASNLDNLRKYGEKQEELEILFNNYQDIAYLTYDNKFNKKSIKSPSNLLLSYTTIDSYNRCAFRYYISNILKLNIYEDTFMTYIGSLFHDILSKAFMENFNFEYEYNTYFENNNYLFNYKEKFFLTKLKEELKFIIETIKKEYTYTSFNKALYEKEINIELMPDVVFKGIIDKIMYKEEISETLISIIDYKTGNLKLNLNNTIHGIEMQLPIYLLLAKNIPEFKNTKIVGFYLQKILHNEIVKTSGKSYNEIKESNLKLGGYSTDNEVYLKAFDSSYEDSKVISSLKKSNKGFYNYAKVLSDDQINNLINITYEKITMSAKNILNNEFDINPKIIGKINKGCEFCKFNDICYKNTSNLVYLKEYKDLSFLND